MPGAIMLTAILSGLNSTANDSPKALIPDFDALYPVAFFHPRIPKKELIRIILPAPIRLIPGNTA